MITTNPTKNVVTGQKGELVAKAYLEELGYKIYQCNVRIGHDEIDIITYDPTDKCLVFAEVKTRTTTSSFFTPMLNIDERKRRALFRAARLFNTYHSYEGAYRIDVLCVIGTKVTEHLQEISS